MATKIALGTPQFSASLPPTTGTYFFVSSTTGSDGNSGLKPERALATLAKAITLCTAAKGDVIVLMPAHAETVTATNINISKSGVTVIGLGTGLQKPTFTYGAAAATITVSAASVVVQNVHHIANFLNVASAYTLTTAKDFNVLNCSFSDNSSILNFLCIVTTGSTANAADGLTFNDNTVYSLPATDGAVISVLANILRLRIQRNFVDKSGVTNDAGHLLTLSTFAAGGVVITDNVLTCISLSNQSAGTLGTGSSTSSSGIVARNLVAQIDTTTGLLWTAGSKISFVENYMTGAADKSGTVFPAADDPA